jgi:twitching motility protein PilT
MNPDTQWLVRLGIDIGLFNRVQALRVRARLGMNPSLVDFAQKLIDEEIVTNVDALEKVAGQAAVRAKKGAPPQDPFLSPEELTPEPAPAREPAQRAEPAQARKPAGAPPPSFDPSKISQSDDSTVAEELKALLAGSVAFGASDLHLCTGRRPFVRKNRVIHFLGDQILGPGESLRINTILLSPEQRDWYEAKKDLDYALAVSESERYRVNLMFHKDGAAGSYRVIPKEIRTMSELGFESHLTTLKKLLSYHNGLVLITGPVGSGKTTTLASMVAYLNETRKDHIITVEDPIEVVQVTKGCNVTQRQVGDHTVSFFSALKGALREDPDIIVIGELRDLETIEMAVSAAETGHLVIGTMHTSDAATTLNRLLDVFPAAQQTQIRGSVAESLRGIVCQRLLPSQRGGLVMACEILVNTVAIANLVRDGKTTGLRNSMETGVREGMCLMDNVIYGLWQDKQISKETALSTMTNRVLRAKIT